MLLKNNTGKIIGIGMESILPGEIKECPVGYEKNPVVLQYVKNGTFEKIESAAEEPAQEKEPKAKAESATEEPAQEEEPKAKGKGKA